jgi:hypothetical protein
MKVFVSGRIVSTGLIIRGHSSNRGVRGWVSWGWSGARDRCWSGGRIREELYIFEKWYSGIGIINFIFEVLFGRIKGKDR